MSIRHGNPGEWAKVKGTVMSLWPLFLCFAALGAFGASVVFGKFPFVFASLFTCVVAVTAFLWRRGVRRVESFFKGARGEEHVAGLLAALPDEWHVFHDFEAGGHHVDHVVAGPAGVFSVETKNWRGRVTVEEGEMIVDGHLADRAPLVQTVRQADAVKAKLKASGWNGDVTPVLCLASDTFAEGVRETGRVAVLNASALVGWLSGRSRAVPANELARLAQLMETRG